MRIPVLIEALPDQRFRAMNSVLSLTAEGATSDDAVKELQSQLRLRLANGGKLVELDTDDFDVTSGEPHPLARFAGCMKDDPLYDEWQKEVAEYRAECDRR